MAFLVLSLPRSRSAWLSHFLSYRDWHCGHEQIRYMRSFDDAKAWLGQPNTGSCETSAAPFWRLFMKWAPDLKIVTVRRPVEDVMKSLWSAGLQNNIETVRKSMTALDKKLDQIEGRLPNVLSVQYEDLQDEETCASVFEHCLPYVHDHDRWAKMDGINIQINFLALTRYIKANIVAINKLASQARDAMMADLASQPVNMQSMVITEDHIETAIVDCAELFRRHCVKVGEHPDNWLNKNIPLMRKLYDMDLLQIMIARSNGRAFGYLFSFICPSLESERMIATHGMFYAAEECPGLGLKLQRAALAGLKKRGVPEAFMRAGIRGDGDRLNILYRRVGAEYFGEMYRVGLEN